MQGVLGGHLGILGPRTLTRMCSSAPSAFSCHVGSGTGNNHEGCVEKWKFNVFPGKNS